jgi:hypothetical protein
MITEKRMEIVMKFLYKRNAAIEIREGVENYGRRAVPLRFNDASSYVFYHYDCEGEFWAWRRNKRGWECFVKANPEFGKLIKLALAFT